MGVRRAGWPDDAIKARLLWLSDSRPYLKPPAGGLVLALLVNLPLSDDSELLDLSDVPSTSVVISPPKQDLGHAGSHQSGWFCEPLHDPTFLVGGDPSIQAFHTFQAWALVDQASGQIYYTGVHRTQAAYGRPLTQPRHLFRVYAELLV